MLDHIMINVRNYERSKAFYQAALASLGYSLIMEVQGWAGFGVDDKPDCWGFWIQGGTPAPLFMSRSVAIVAPRFEPFTRLH